MITRPPTSHRGTPRPTRPRPTATGTPLRGAIKAAPLWVRIGWIIGITLVLSLLLWILRPVFAVLAASAGLAYLLDPIADWLEARGMNRDRAVGVIFVSFLLGALVVVVVLVPSFARQTAEISERIGPFIANLDQHLAPLLLWISDLTGQNITLNVTDLQRVAPQWISEHTGTFEDTAQEMVGGLLTRGLGLLNAVINLTLLPIFVYYLLRDWDRLVAAIHDLIPPDHRARVTRITVEVDRRLSAFVRGQITVGAIMAGLYCLGLLIVGIDLAIPVGLLSGALMVVPYVGSAIGVALASILALVKFGIGWEVVQVWSVFVVVQGIEGYLLTPKIVGDKVGLHPLVVMVALIVGGSLLGLWGMVLAIPITAALSVFAGEWLELYRASPIFEARADARPK